MPFLCLTEKRSRGLCAMDDDFSTGEVPFRALDLLSSPIRAGSSLQEAVGDELLHGEFSEPPATTFGDIDGSLDEFELVGDDSLAHRGNVEIISDDDEPAAGLSLNHGGSTGNTCMLRGSEWNLMVSSQFSQYREQFQGMQYPWEQGVLSQIFGETRDLTLPTCTGLAEPVNFQGVEDDLLTPKGVDGVMPVDAKFTSVISSTKDLEYFESKNQKLELACAQWLELLSISWKAFGIGEVVANALHTDASGQGATEILRACFGIKSPSTLLKRASSFRQFVRWYDETGYGVETMADPFPIRESAVWEYFLWLREKRRTKDTGFTLPASFLETVRFAKFTVDLKDADSIISSRRLLGFAAIEKKNKGPTKQAPGLELEHVRRLHEILMSDANAIDRLASGCFLICLYGRARWSDVRYVDHVVVEKGRHGSLTLYTTEHKTSSVGARREQYLPLVIPWEGITSDPWLETFLELYESVGLQIDKRPLGPLLPAPKVNGTFCARPVSTAEAAKWLRALLSGTADSESYRSHSLKATVLIWSAKAGFDRETRAVLGHHCTATSGSDVVYSRHLQTRALRKLSMLLRRLRIGLGFEDDVMREMGISGTPVPFTPMGLKTPAPDVPELQVVATDCHAAPGASVLDSALHEMNELEELQSVKQEVDDLSAVANSAGELTLFDEKYARSGVIELDSSSGSSSDDSTSSDGSDQQLAERSIIKDYPKFEEHVPDGFDFYRHNKSCIIHKCSVGLQVSNCKLQMSDKYKLLERTFHVKFPKCLKCFPKDHNRLRCVEDMTSAIDRAAKKARGS